MEPQTTTGSLMRTIRIRSIEVATVAAVLGIFVSLAVPSLLRIQARSRVEHLLESARFCRAELSGWISNSLSDVPENPDAPEKEGVDGLDVRGIFEAFARVYNERFSKKKGQSDEPLLVVEPTGTLPIYCSRDGRIHLIPFADSSLESIGAILVVMDEDGRYGRTSDGILAVYSVEPGTK